MCIYMSKYVCFYDRYLINILLLCNYYVLSFCGNGRVDDGPKKWRKLLAEVQVIIVLEYPIESGK